jgi:xanthine/CO dehydrogenase XdhC/CoxF family maturation factor
MRELQEILRHLTSGRDMSGCVLGTLVTVDGSSYRRPGARLLRTADGRRIGSISGGCLEEDVLIRAGQVAADGRPYLVVYDTTPENDLIWGAGQGCRGVVRVLLERLPPRPSWAVVLAENLNTGRPTDLEVVWEADDPVELGTDLKGVRSYIVPSAAEGTMYDLTPSKSRSVFVERIDPPPALFIFGAGDDARPLAGFASELGWKVTVADPRPALVTTERFPNAALLGAGPADTLVERASPAPGSLAVVMTHQFAHDLRLLRDLLPLPLAYLGLLGPKSRADRILEALEAEGRAVTPAMRTGLRAPVGLDLGAETPEEVSLSIVVEMQIVLSGCNARPLREKKGRIHG